MKKSLMVIGAALLFAMTAAAWNNDYPQYGVYLGYQFVRFNPNSDFVPSFNANGGGGQFAYNFNKWLSGVIDVGAVNKGTLNQVNVDTTVMNFCAGPRYTFRHWGRWVPYAQVLFGGHYSTSSVSISALIQPNTVLPPGFIVNPNLPVSARLTASDTGFAMLAGGGLDVKLGRHIYFRPVEADYYLTRVSSTFTNLAPLVQPAVPLSTSNRNNFRYSAGVNFVFGEAK